MGYAVPGWVGDDKWGMGSTDEDGTDSTDDGAAAIVSYEAGSSLRYAAM